MTEEKIYLAESLKQLRRKQQVSLRKLAEMSGINITVCDRAENGDASHATTETLINTINNNVSDKVCDCGKQKALYSRLCTKCYMEETV